MLLEALSIFVALVVVIITFYKRKFRYWEDLGVPCIEPSIPFGNLPNPFQQKEGISETIERWYRQFCQQGRKHGGVYFLARPAYMIMDLEYIKNIMAKDFTHFTDRGTYYDEVNDPLSAHLFNIGGNKWRNLRMKFTPTFTSGKMKLMCEKVIDCGNNFKALMDDLIDSREPIDIKEATGRFTIDIIGTCAFGLECNSIMDRNSPFRVYGEKIFKRTPWKTLVSGFAINYPAFGRAIRFKIIPEDTSNFFMNLVKTTVKYREKNDIRRNDFLQILIDLKNNPLEDDNKEYDGKKLTIEEVAAQCLVFFIGGFETSSTLMSFALLELSLNQASQNKAREEVKEVLERHNNEMTYECLGELKYLEQILNETMRLYPPVGFLFRKCVKDYKVPDTDLLLAKGTRVWMSVAGIHHDERYYPEPEKFDPERFSDENRSKIPHYAYLPFGEGPRICIGLRFGMMQAKIGMSVLLSNYKFRVDSKTELPIKMDPSIAVTSAKGGIWLRAERLQTEL